jgi:acyl-CoA oxidase
MQSNRHRKARFRYSGDCGDLDMFIDAFAFRAAHMLERLVTLRDVDGRPWNTLLVDMFKVSRAHAEFHLIWNFAAALRSNADRRGIAALRSVLHMVFELFGRCSDLKRNRFLADMYELQSLQHYGSRNWRLLEIRVHVTRASGVD